MALAGVLAAASVPTALPNLPPSYDANTIIAAPTPTPITLDGTVEANWGRATPVWISTGFSGAFVRTLYDGTNLYMLVQWDDATEDHLQDAWLLQDNSTAQGTWARTTWGDDGVALLLDDGKGLEQNFSQAGCGTLCHVNPSNEMRTAAGTLDGWHWSSSFSAPLGYADDMYLDSMSMGNGSATGGWHGDGPDPRQDNSVTTGFGPRPGFLNGSVPAAQSARHIALANATPINWSTFNSSSMPKGTTVPGYVLADPATARSEVRSGAVHNGSAWTVELMRPLGTADNASRDLAFLDLNATYFVSLALFDNATGSNHTRAAFSHKMIFAANALPDLVPEAATPGSPTTTVGNPISVTVRVRNMGFGNTTGAVFVAIWDDAAASEVDNITIPALAWGDFYLANLTFPSGGYSVGPHNFTALVDTDDAQAESFENNNSLAFQVVVAAVVLESDLVIETAVGPSGLLFGGDAFTVNGTVRNQGAGGTVADVVVEAGHPLFGNRSLNLGPLDAGASANFSLAFNVSGVPAGSYGLAVVADPSNAIDEGTPGNESNNTNVVVVTVEDRPDLFAAEISADPAAGIGGDVLLLNLTVENRGAAFNGTVNVYLYFDDGGSTNATNRTDAFSIDLDLARGANTTYSTTWGIPFGTAPGNHSVRAWIDAGNLLNEFVETNNNATVRLLVIEPPRPDLVLSNLLISASSFRPSEQATINVTVSNTGAAYSGTVRLWVLEATLNRSLGNLTVSNIGPGQSSTYTASFAIPSGIVGLHSVLVILDADDAVDEANELNNALSVGYTLLNPTAPDLVVSGPVYLPTDPLPGTTLSLSVTVRNAGSSASAPSTITLAWVATVLGTTQVGVLQPGEQYNASFTWNTAAVTSLSALLSFSVDDPTGRDANLTNNALVFSVSFRAPGAPSLHISGLTVAPSTPVKVGDFVRIEVTVTNNGTAAGNGSVRFVVGNLSMTPINFTLNPGETRVINATWTAAGVGNVTVRADLQAGGFTISNLGNQARVQAPAAETNSPVLVYVFLAIAVAAAIALVMLLMRGRGGAPSPAKPPAEKKIEAPAKDASTEEE